MTVQIQYRELFRIECLHEYFADHVCRVLTLSPTDACRQLLKRYRCRFRPAPGGGAVYYGAHDGETLLPLFREERPFVFTLTSSDPMISTYTAFDDGRASPAETIYHFDNLMAQVGDVGGKDCPSLLPPNTPARALPVKRCVFRHTFAEPMSGEMLQLFDIPAEREVWEAAAPVKEFRSCALDLPRLSPGRYQLHLDGEEILEFYLSDTPAPRQWGVVEIFAQDPGLAVPESCRVIDAAGLASPKTFTVSLTARQTYWRYHIVSQSTERSFENYRIVGGPPKPAKPVAFNDPKPENVAGRDAWLFESVDRIPLYEVPMEHHEFALEATGPERKPRRPVKLPYAQSKTTRLSGESKPPRMCSDIYVYL